MGLLVQQACGTEPTAALAPDCARLGAGDVLGEAGSGRDPEAVGAAPPASEADCWKPVPPPRGPSAEERWEAWKVSRVDATFTNEIAALVDHGPDALPSPVPTRTWRPRQLWLRELASQERPPRPEVRRRHGAFRWQGMSLQASTRYRPIEDELQILPGRVTLSLTDSASGRVFRTYTTDVSATESGPLWEGTDGPFLDLNADGIDDFGVVVNQYRGDDIELWLSAPDGVHRRLDRALWNPMRVGGLVAEAHLIRGGTAWGCTAYDFSRSDRPQWSRHYGIAPDSVAADGVPLFYVYDDPGAFHRARYADAAFPRPDRYLRLSEIPAVDRRCHSYLDLDDEAERSELVERAAWAAEDAWTYSYVAAASEQAYGLRHSRPLAYEATPRRRMALDFMLSHD